jgi:FlaA1/EpsC-like NDP-sugar epimerase
MRKIINKLTSWYFSKGALPYWIILMIDCLIVAFAGYAAFYTQWGGSGLAGRFWLATRGIIISEVFFIVYFRLFHTYSGVIRYSSMMDLVHVALATLIGTATTYLLGLLATWQEWSAVCFPKALGCLEMFLVATVLMWIERILVKYLYDGFVRDDKAKRVFIYGVKEGGIAIAKSLQNEMPQRFSVVGFVSPDGDLQTKWLMGLQVRRDGPNLIKHIKDAHASILIVSPLQEERFRNNPKLVDDLITQGIKIMMFPTIEEWNGKDELKREHLHEVNIEDLLPRDRIEVDMDAIGSMLSNKCILITGAAGSIGSEMVRQIAPYQPSRLVLIDQAETPMHDVRLMMKKDYAYIPCETIVTSITNREHMERIFSRYRPEYVFHAAAYKHVPMMEDNPAIAVQNNIYGTRVIADLAVKYGTKKFVMISTDKAVNPTNVMGCSKRICEIYCQSLNHEIERMNAEGKSQQDSSAVSGPRQADGSLPVTQFVTTRFGNVLGSNGSVIPIFREQIKRGGPITVTHPDIIRFFMLIPEACKLVLEAGTMGHGGEIFVFDMGKPVKIVELAERMIKLSGAKNIKIEFTGLRDGEKLYEEVLSEAERTMPTHHPKIMIATVREYEYATALQNEERLMDASHSFDDMAIVKIMKEIVPEYKSRCSKYEVLDK